jgi:hypothetical protein
LPQTNEVLAFAQLIGLSNQSVEVSSRENDPASVTVKNHNEILIVNTNDPTQTLISSSSSSSSISLTGT